VSAPRAVLVTGSTRGIGRGIADECGRAGLRVVVSSRKADAVAETVTALRSDGVDAVGRAADVTRFEDVQDLLAFAVDAFGKVDVWVNNAGLGGGYRPLEEMSGADIDAIVSTNLTGTLFGSKVALEHFAGTGKGILINVTGRGGDGRATPFTAAYAATKAAVTSVTKSLAEENRDIPVSIHLLQPGMVDTDFYTDLVVSPCLEESAGNVPLVLEAFGARPEDSGRKVVEIAAQEPGVASGKSYSALGGARTMRGVARIIWMRMRGDLARERRVRG
jgi:NAD(P)-dependent dehydrogenase (short-subunit alcohol dehydrogenase family)